LLWNSIQVQYKLCPMQSLRECGERHIGGKHGGIGERTKKTEKTEREKINDRYS